MISLAERNQTVRNLIREFGSNKTSELGKADRIAVYAVATGEKLGLSDEKLLVLRYASQLHEIADVAQIQRILGPIEWLQDVIPILCSFHEHFDRIGSGDSAEDQMSMETQILAICMEFNSLTHSIPSQSSVSEEQAIAQLRNKTGTVFAAEIVEAFASIQSLIQPLSGSS